MRPSPVGAFTAAGGVGPGGVEDQAGNVLEWISSLYLPYPYNALLAEKSHVEGERIVRGGSWCGICDIAHCASRYHLFPDNFSLDVGFRLFSPG